ncbi:type II toxin-antitoxin system VapC family toxin [Calidithermus roseus]|uniref:PIN domain protein n=1 Tax=Calidithermus roseus TaxID=1644118 RepID=A0A399F1Y3_9DEIN|nr:PIN domain-containing protein [Calidithermus roseus]RIH89269.1 PIN domain protein [Calidithermus roseus]
MSKYVLDTNLLIAAIRLEPKALQALSRLQKSRVVIADVAFYELMLGEFLVGDSRSKEARQRRRQREILLAGIDHLPFDAKAAEIAAKAQAQLKQQNQGLELRDLFNTTTTSKPS